MSAQTETTRAAAPGTRIDFVQSGVVKRIEIRTAMDERVCPVCGPLHGTRHALESGVVGRGLPPFHPGCRCWIVAVVEDAAVAKTPEQRGRNYAMALRGREYVTRQLKTMDVDALARQVLAADELPAAGYHFVKHGCEMGAASEAEYVALFREVMEYARQQSNVLFVAWRNERRPDLMWYIFDGERGLAVQFNQMTGQAHSFYKVKNWGAFLTHVRPVQVILVDGRWELKPQ